MTLIDFLTHFPDEESCKQKFKAYRDQVGVVCPKCGGSSHYWKKDKEQYECKHCKTRITLKSGTVMRLCCNGSQEVIFLFCRYAVN